MNTRLLILLSLAALWNATSPAPAAQLYLETFSSPTTFGSSGTWRGYNTSSATLAGPPLYGNAGITSSNAGASPITAPSGNTLDPYLFAQNATSTSSTTTVDYFFFTTVTTASASFANFTPSTPSSYSQLSATWQQNTGGTMTGMKYYFTVQVGGTWYGASTGDAGYTGASAPSSATYSLDLLNANWYAVNFSAGSSMSLDPSGVSLTSSSLFGSSNSITGLGFYVKDFPGANTTGSDFRTIRFDNLAINATAVPEPGRCLLLATALGVFLLRRRRLGVRRLDAALDRSASPYVI